MGLYKDIVIPEEYVRIAREEFEQDLKGGKVRIKRFVRGDLSKLEQECIKIKASSSSMTVSADVNSADYRDLTVVRAVVEAPWKTGDLNTFRGLPTFIADFLEQEVKEFNTLEVKKKEPLNISSETQ
jgi:hypothetical protein